MHRIATAALLTATSAMFPVALAACGGDPRNTVDFCAELRTSTALLTDGADPAALVETYRRLDDRTPLRIKDAWHEITLLLERITTFDASSNEETQAVIADALRARTAMETVASWADSTCKVKLSRPSANVPVSDTIALSEVPDESTPPLDTAP